MRGWGWGHVDAPFQWSKGGSTDIGLAPLFPVRPVLSAQDEDLRGPRVSLHVWPLENGAVDGLDGWAAPETQKRRARSPQPAVLGVLEPPRVFV